MKDIKKENKVKIEIDMEFYNDLVAEAEIKKISVTEMLMQAVYSYFRSSKETENDYNSYIQIYGKNK